jgi:hypothetical protein
MIHVHRHSIETKVLPMTLAATADVGVKCGGLPREQRFVVGVTDDALLRLDSFDRCVASVAVVFEKRVGSR